MYSINHANRKIKYFPGVSAFVLPLFVAALHLLLLYCNTWSGLQVKKIFQVFKTALFGGKILQQRNGGQYDKDCGSSEDEPQKMGLADCDHCHAHDITGNDNSKGSLTFVSSDRAGNSCTIVYGKKSPCRTQKLLYACIIIGPAVNVMVRAVVTSCSISLLIMPSAPSFISSRQKI